MRDDDNSNDKSPSNSDAEDNSAFRELVKDVRPLKPADRVRLPKGRSIDPVEAQTRRKRAEGDDDTSVASALNHDGSYVSDDYVDMVKPDDLLAFKRPGVQEGVYRKLRLGKYELQARLDLHRKTVKEARAELFDFLRECEARDLRCLLVLHGKGERNTERQAVLKSYTAKWLKEVPQVLAFHSAQQNHGGMGAVYVLLRKSERMKELTRERLGKRGRRD